LESVERIFRFLENQRLFSTASKVKGSCDKRVSLSSLT